MTLQAKPSSLEEFLADAGCALRVTDIAARVGQAARTADAVALLYELRKELGLDGAAFASFIRDDDSRGSYRILLAADPTWCSDYQNSGWFSSDPYMLYAASRSEPIRGRDIECMSQEQHKILSLSQQYGFRSSCLVPTPSSGALSRVGALLLGSSREGYFDGAGFHLVKVLTRSVAMEMHEWCLRQVREDLARKARITPEDLALLTRERKGLASKTIGDELGLSPAAVDTKFRRLNSRLGVPNRKAAARLAAEVGLL